MMNSIKTFMEGCPALSGINININYLGESALSGAIENVSVEPIIKTYTDGGSMRQYIFGISLRQNYGQTSETNSTAINMLEQVADWIETQNTVGILPALSGNQSPISLEIFKTGNVDNKTADTANYMLQCRLVYYKD